MRECRQCGVNIPNTIKIDGKIHVIKNRRYCLTCVPFKSGRGSNINGKLYNIPDEEFKLIVSQSVTFSDVLRSVGLKTVSGNYDTIKNKIKKLNIDISHFDRNHYSRVENRRKAPPEKYNKRDMKDILVEDSTYRGNDLRKRLINEGYFESKCYTCGITKWNDLPAPLEVHHLNGKHFDNRIENLTIICPNCHAQTPNYRARNMKKS